MNRFFAVLFLVSCIVSHSSEGAKPQRKLGLTSSTNPYTYRVDTSSTNLTTSFPTKPQIGFNIKGPANAISVIQVYNGSSSEIEVNCSSATAPSSLSTTSVYVPGTTGYQSIAPSVSQVSYPFGNTCFLRAVSGTISSGVITLIAWGY